MKKRILYIILGVMLLSVKGVGQSFTFDVSSGYNIYPAENCDQVIFSANNPSSSSISLEIYYSNDGIATYNRLPTGYSIPANSSDYTFPVFQTGFYFVKWKNGAVVIQTSSTKRIVINPLPNATVAASSTICNGYPVSLGSTEISGNTYSWSSNVGTYSSTESNPSVNPTVTQTYRLTETITSTGCYNSNDVTITVNNVSSGSISGTQALCVGGDPIEFTSLVDGGGSGVLTYKWEFKPNGQIGWTEDPTLLSSTYNPPSELTRTTDYRRFTISTLNSVSCTSTPTNEINVTVNPIPSAPTIASNTPICEGATLTFSSANVPGGTFSWTGVNGFSSSLSNPTRSSATTSMTGNYSATVTVLGCTSPSSTISATVNPIPSAPTIASNTPICEGATLTFSSANVPGGTFSWTGVNGFSSSLSNPTRSSATTSMTGNYSATVTVIGCTSPSSTISATVNPIPSAPTIASNTPICEGATLTFSSANVPGGTFSWTGVNGFSSSLPNPTISSATTAASGSYSATVTVNGCTSPSSIPITTNVYAIPNAPTITSNTPICVGSDLTFSTANVSGGTFSWSGVNGFSSSTQNPTISSATTSASGSYSATVTVNGCTSPSSIPIIVTINPRPIVSATSTPVNGEVCLGSNVTLNGAGASRYTFSGGVINAIAFAPTTTTTYTVTGTDANGCVNTNTISVKVNPLPAAPTANSVALNYNGLEQTTPDLIPPSGQSISWFTSSVGGLSSTKPKGINADTYNSYASAINDATGCISSSRTLISLTINKVPIIITAENKTKVYGEANPILTYTYSGLVNGDLATATWPTILTTALPNSAAGTYPIIPSAATDPNYTITYVEGTLTVTKAPLTITAKPHTITYNGTSYAGGNGVVPTGLISGETISNLTGTLTYAGTSQGAKNVGTYTILPDGLSSPNYNINFVGGTLEIKKVTLNVVAGDQSVNFGTEIAKILNDAVSTYTGLVGGDNASDITGSVTYSTNYTPLTSTGSAGIYIEPIIIGLSAANYELIAEKGTITITAPPSSPVFQIPNAFTPNSDGHNDTFRIIQNGYVTRIIGFKIFTKSGKLIFSNTEEAWDGRFAGVMLDSDVYIWIADFINKNNIQEHLTGTVLLLK